MVIPELFYAGVKAQYGKETAEEIVKFTIQNQDALLGLANDIPDTLRESSELRQLEILHVFTAEKPKANAEALVKLLDSELPSLQRRCRLLSKEQLKDVCHAYRGRY